MPLSLNRREKYAVYTAAGLIVLFLLIQFAVFPTIDKRDRLKRILQVKTEILHEMFDLKSEYDTIQNQEELSKGLFSDRKKGFRLFSFLDRLAGETGIKDHIAYMKPSNSIQKDGPFKISMVEMKLQEISLQKLTDYLYSIETSKDMVTVRRASFVKKAGGPGAIDAVLQVETVDI